MQDSKSEPYKIALCRHCSARITHEDATGWSEQSCDGDSGNTCPYNASGHEPDNPHLAHLRNPSARDVEWVVKS
jgi:hypothetical protein